MKPLERVLSMRRVDLLEVRNLQVRLLLVLFSIL